MIPKNKKRVLFTLHEDTVRIIKSLKPLLEVRNESEVIELAVVSYADAIFQMLKVKENKENEKN